MIELRATFERARTLCDSLKNAEEYHAEPSSNTHSPESEVFALSKDPSEQVDCASSRERSAFCGKPAHLRSKCPASSGVFKGRRARHLPWAPLFGGPLEVLRG